ncbi:spinster family MFS transporter [Sphingobium nicotianae]|uniref:MFS transporter n=1 Tax=Sphingobium nicotianae TaxID=2782607 RepID=A0A9X1DCP4_9SPHN|nr:MFS transporter [Sphingobium nicotianae]MBT2187449.1 MFS transporter [Sphingobium nicotianae]
MSGAEQGVIGSLSGAVPTGPSPDMSAAERRTARIVLATLFVVYFLSSVDRSIFGILAQPVKEELLLQDWQIGFLSGVAFSAVQLVFGFPMARFTDKGSRVGILSVCVALWSVLTALCGLATSFVQLSLYRMGVGVGEASCMPASHSLISDYFPRSDRVKALALYGLGFPIGSFVGIIIGGIVQDHWGWRAAFYVLGVPGLFVALLTWKVIKEPPRGRYDIGAEVDPAFADPRPFSEVALMLWRSPVLRQMILGLTLLSLFDAPTATFLGPFLARKFPLSYTQLAFIMSMSMMLGASLSTYFGGIISQRLARRDERWLMWFTGVTTAMGAPLYCISLMQTEWLPLAIWMFLGALVNATFFAPCYTVLYNIVPPGGRAKALVIVGFFSGFLGLSVGPLLAGIANDVVSGILFGGYDPRGFVAACPGGHAAKGAAVALDLACRKAVGDATQMVLIVTMAATVWPCWHFFRAAKHMKTHSL